MEKRASERIPIDLGIRFFSADSMYCGTVTNCSEKGMYIKTMISFPFDSIFEILIPVGKDMLKVPVKICRLVRTGDICEGMGVELLDIPKEYLEFVVKPNLVSRV